LTIRLYFDEDANHGALIEALRSRGMDALTSTEAGTRGHSDEEQLEFAKSAEEMHNQVELLSAWGER
jgi:hypothetical protein